ncbi:hypothetical protein ACPPVS_17020 [Cellulomonas sp. McL0617]|uniref:hypothetical protein n=1 Tax=Cellulomonas sp. McL0617 TaxID=3415675 RepID=UPI003CF56E0C
MAFSDVFRRRTPWTLVDAVERHRLAPDTFRIPSDEATAALRVGDQVKVVVEPDTGLVERVWLTVAAVDDLVGTLNTDAVELHGLRAGDRVPFERRHVIAIRR